MEYQETDHLVDELGRAVEAWDARGWPRPGALVVSGSGLAVDLPGATGRDISLADVLPFELHAVIGHPHRVQLLEPLPGRYVFYQRGRVHAYQGYTAPQTVFMIRLAALLGARTLVMSNAAGGLNRDHRPGQLCAISDHMNLSGLNPLRGEPPAEWGLRFPDLVDAYDPDLRRLASRLAAELEDGNAFDLGAGVYGGLPGPSYETPAEIAMLRSIGAELVGMSTVLEVIAARHMGMRCLCFSLISNLAAGDEGPLHHQEVLDAGRDAAGRMASLLAALLRRDELYSDSRSSSGNGGASTASHTVSDPSST